MGNQQNVIVINGKRYDAKTGQLLGVAATNPASKSAPTNTAVIDGFYKKTRNNPGSQPHKSVHTSVAKSKTLMRTAVKKPVLIPKAPTVKNESNNITKRPIHNDHHRLVRAHATQKHKNVSKFGAESIKTAVAHVPFTHPPVSQKSKATLPEAHNTKPHSNIFESVIERAESHMQPKVSIASKKERFASRLRMSPKVLSFSGFALSLVIVSSFIVYQHVPNISMRVAATRSGVEGQIPGYKPAGFAMAGPIAYSPGEITINFASRTDDRQFRVTQRASEWNSQSLLENYVVTSQRPYQTMQDKGKTIYIYDGSNATWVNRGVWYQIEGESALSNDQLLRIANSL